jgi:proline racemase
MGEKQAHLRQKADDVRRFLMREPRGHRDMFGAILTAPVSAGADFGVLFVDNEGSLTMCGHATIGVGTALVEAGLVPPVEPVISIRLDTVAGLIHLRVAVEASRATAVTFENVPAFVAARDVRVTVEDHGPVTLDIAFGGNFFGILDAAQVGLTIAPESAGRLAEAGRRIREAVNAAVPLRHPTLPHPSGLQIVTFRSPAGDAGASYRNVHVFAGGQVDRSPGGTGTSAVMALLHARGELPLGQAVVAEGILGGRFRGRLLRPLDLAGIPAVVPEVTGSAHVTGLHQFLLDPDDPWPEGFVIG